MHQGKGKQAPPESALAFGKSVAGKEWRGNDFAKIVRSLLSKLWPVLFASVMPTASAFSDHSTNCTERPKHPQCNDSSSINSPAFILAMICLGIAALVCLYGACVDNCRNKPRDRYTPIS